MLSLQELYRTKKGDKMLNIFKINLDKIELPNDAYIYRVEFKTNNKKDVNKTLNFLQNNFGFLDRSKLVLYSYEKIDFNRIPNKIKNHVELEFDSIVNIDKLEEKAREKVIDTYLRKKIKKDIKIILKEKLSKKYLKSNKIGRWKIYLSLDRDRVELLNYNDEKYAAFNIKVKILGCKNLWDWVNRDENTLKKLCWTEDKNKDIKLWFRYAPDIKEHKDTNYILTKVISDKSNFEWLKEYPFKHKGINIEELKKLANFENFDENQPIIEGIPHINRDPYPFLPQYCIPAYNIYIASEEENKEIFKIINDINFKKKNSIILDIVHQLNYLDNSNNDWSKHLIKIKNNIIKLKVKFAKVDLKKKKNKIEVGNPKEVFCKYISNTAELFKWFKYYWDLKNGNKMEVNDVEIPIPNFVPEFFNNMRELETFILIEHGLSKETINDILYSAVWGYNIIMEVTNKVYGDKRLPKLNFRGKTLYFKNNDLGVDKIFKQICNMCNGKLGFAFIFGKYGREVIPEDEDEIFDYYAPLKIRLFNNNILSQNFNIEKYINNNKKVDYKSLRYSLSNVIYNIFSKLGIKFFELGENSLKNTLILGIDVGYGEFYSGKVTGCTTVYDENGVLRNIIPVKKESSPNKETAKIKALLEEIDLKYMTYKVDFENRNIIILRDGRLIEDEIEQLKEFSKKKKCKIIAMDVKKNTVYQLFRKDSNSYYINLENFYLLKCHNPRRGYPRLIKIINRKIVIDKGISKEEPITREDILLLYKLAALNYSSIGNSCLKIPSPIYYADKFLKALKRGWSLKEEYLKYGLLYFI